VLSVLGDELENVGNRPAVRSQSLIRKFSALSPHTKIGVNCGCSSEIGHISLILRNSGMDVLNRPWNLQLSSIKE
jgi:hypothetical protein